MATVYVVYDWIRQEPVGVYSKPEKAAVVVSEHWEYERGKYSDSSWLWFGLELDAEPLTKLRP